MSRPQKKPNYNPENLMQQLLSEVSEAYLTPTTGYADTNGHMQLKRLAEEFSMTANFPRLSHSIENPSISFSKKCFSSV